MADCSNVEIRELLPERAGNALSAADVARVDAHLAGCGLCTAELALIAAARRTLRTAPAIDVARISAAVVAATAVPSRPQLVTSGGRASIARPAPRLRWVGWKAAAAIAIAAAGIGSFAVYQSTDDSTRAPNGAVVAIASPEQTGAAGSRTAVTATATSAATPSEVAAAGQPRPAAPPELGVAGGLNDLSSSDLETLLGDLGGRVDIAADASFEDPESVLPEVGDINGGESI